MQDHNKMTMGFLITLILIFAIIIEVLIFISLINFIKIERDIQFHQHEFIRLKK